MNSTVYKMSQFVRYNTNTEMKTSIAFKLTLLRFLNSAFVLLGANVFSGDYSSNNWFESGYLVDDMFLSILGICFAGSILNFVNEYIYKRC